MVALDGGADSSVGEVARHFRDVPVLLVVGSEGAGVSRLTAERADALARIDMPGRAESLNASVAAGIALYALSQARENAGAAGSARRSRLNWVIRGHFRVSNTQLDLPLAEAAARRGTSYGVWRGDVPSHFPSARAGAYGGAHHWRGGHMKLTEGLFGWVDLMSTDTGAARDFYTKLFGWTADDVPTPVGVPTQFYNAGALVAGMAPVPPNLGQMPSVWNSYVITADVDGAAERAVAAGGKVVMPVMDIMTQGRMGMFADPSGAVVGALAAQRAPGRRRVQCAVLLTWNELQTRDLAAALPFYADVFGFVWQDGPTPDYKIGTFPTSPARTSPTVARCPCRPTFRRACRVSGWSTSPSRTALRPWRRRWSWADRCCSPPWRWDLARSADSPTRRGGLRRGSFPSQ